MVAIPRFSAPVGALLAVLLCGGVMPNVAAAEPFPARVSTPKVPKPRKIPASEVPAAVRKEIPEISEGPLQAAEVDVVEVDLNADGGKELLVFNPMSYTGGQIIWMFASAKEKYRSIGMIQGAFYLASLENGWNRIVADCRAPGGFLRVLYAFENGAYTSVREAEYASAANGRETYVKELTPRR